MAGTARTVRPSRPRPAPATWLPRVVSMGCLLTRPQDGFGGHSHRFDELCLITGSSTRITHADTPTRAEHGQCYLFRSGEWHGYHNSPQQAPHLWVLHYWPDPQLYRDCPALVATDAHERIWTLDATQIEDFRTLFMRVLAEQDPSRTHANPAAAAWLRLLLVTLSRWRTQSTRTSGPALPTTDPEIMRLWQLLNDHVGSPACLAETLRREIPNYDSLRHRFTRTFKASPREVLMSLRIKRAKSLLLETELPISAISERLGYARQHEFTRAFHREVGRSPSAWRTLGGDSAQHPQHA